ncbi:efflux RND transporter periplasmic adaptor subunit, partial [Candidatus Sumerlaeota bacterium]|nr:efflux RND transporter periplasmic adaptor subunit [Candidatus Sumerlaeota bacterium]
NLKARLAELKTGSRPQEIEAAKASVVSAEATYKMRKLDWERIQRLAEKKIISQQELDQMRQAHDVAAAALDQAKKNAELVIIGPRKEVIAATEAQLHEAEANLEFARTQLDYTVIRAPISGTILEKVAKKGELVTNMNFGGTRGAKSSAVSMADLNDLQIELDISENDIPKVKMGQKCEIKLDSDPDKVFKGEVDEISPQADRQKAQVQVKVKVFNPEGALIRPEVNARVTFLEEEKPKAVAAANDPPAAPRVWIPKNAIVTGEKGQMVYIASGNTAVARTVKTKGEEGPRGVEVIEGLLGSESLIIEPLDKIKDGVKIAVTTS